MEFNGHQILDYFLGKDGNYTFIILITVCLLLLISHKLFHSKSTLKTLPGPLGLPIVGYLPFLTQQPHKKFVELKKKYGPVFKVKLGSVSCIVLSDFEAMKDAFIKQREIFSSRPKELSFRIFEEEEAFVYADGEHFKRVRNFCMDTLKKLGFGRLSLEPLVKFEVEKLIEELMRNKDKPIYIHDRMTLSVGNAICSLLTGQRLNYSDPWLIHLIDTVNSLYETYVNDIGLFFPWMKKIPLLNRLTHMKKQLYWKGELWKLWETKIEEIVHDKDKTNGDSFISMWLAEEATLREKNDPDAEMFSRFSLKNNLDILSQASFETTSTTLLWAVLNLMKYPEVQKRLRKEIDGLMETKGEELSFVDLKFLPYLKAFIQETHRYAAMVPLGVFHANNRDTSLMGYHIPKRTVVIPNIHAVLHDEKDFPNPREFKPERFLSENGEYISSEKLIPFSLGRRFCPGEYVAQMEIFNYLINILHTFEIKLPAGSTTDVDPICTNSLVSRPQKFKVIFSQRKAKE